MKQEKYREYVRVKQEQEEWEKKEVVLNVKAEQFNSYRLIVPFPLLRNTSDGGS